MAQREANTQAPALNSDLDSYQDIIRQLYVVQNLSVQNVMGVMSAMYGLNASKSMYKSKFKKWNMNKPNKAVERVRPQPSKDRRFIIVHPEIRMILHTRASRSSRVRSLTSPTMFRIQEEMLHATRMHVSQRLELRLQLPESTYSRPLSWKNVPLEKRQRLGNAIAINKANAAIGNTADFFQEGRISLAMSSLAQAFRLFEDFVREDHFSIMGTLCVQFTLIQESKKVECVSLMLKYLHSMGSICHGDTHPLTIWSKTFLKLLQMNKSEPISLLVIKLYADVFEEVLGPEDQYTQLAKAGYHMSTYVFRVGRNLSVDDLDQEINSRIDQIPKHRQLSAIDNSIASMYVFLMLNVKNFHRAETILMSVTFPGLDLSNIPFHDHTEDLHIYLAALLDYAHAFAGQAKFEPAMKICAQIIPILNDSDAPFTINILESLVNVLGLIKLDDQVKAIYTTLDERLLPYLEDKKDSS